MQQKKTPQFFGLIKNSKIWIKNYMENSFLLIFFIVFLTRLRGFVIFQEAEFSKDSLSVLSDSFSADF
jgi:hypothetical protein